MALALKVTFIFHKVALFCFYFQFYVMDLKKGCKWKELNSSDCSSEGGYELEKKDKTQFLGQKEIDSFDSH